MASKSWRWPLLLAMVLLAYLGLRDLSPQGSALAGLPVRDPETVTPDTGDNSAGEACADCHLDVDAQFQMTAHATAPGWNAAQACSSCHGPGEAHSESTDPADIVRPSTLDPLAASEICLSCHKIKHSGFQFGQSIHKMSDVSCIDCHDPHSTADQMLPKGGVDLCATCHETILAEFRLARSHPLSDSDAGCANCHNPHGSKNVRSLGTFGNEACGACHFEKAGPFLYYHDVTNIDGCRSCHRVHGSPNRHLLTDTRQINLCYRCHSAAFTPGFHSAATFVNEKCTACHTAIHGSNTNPFFLEE